MRRPLERLFAGELLIGDGSWGTMLIARGLAPGACPEAWNLDRPADLEVIAAEYLEAGAELVTTNTFGGSPLRLACYDLEDQTEAINRAAVEAVRRAVGDRAYVSASVGPTGTILKPYGDTDPDTVAAAFQRQIAALAEAGADLVCVETMIDLEEARLAVGAAKELAPELPVVATMTFDATPRGFFTAMGVTVEQACAGLEAAGADVVGSNCGNGIEAMVAIAARFVESTELPVAIQSNAGLPVHRDGEIVYPEGPEDLAAGGRRMAELGVRLIGGCCGTTPAHIRALRSALKPE